MILGSLKDSARYEHIHPLIKKAFDYLKSMDFTNAESGKTEIQGTDLFLSVSDSKLKNESDAKIEVHDKYIDIQVPISKTEKMGWTARCDLKTPKDKFNTEKDIQFFEDKSSLIFPVVPGNFVIFFPEDGHAPCIGEGSVKKIVVKIKL